MKRKKYIQRIDYKYTHGYQVRFCRNGSVVTDSKMFSDGVHGGKREALKAAIAWRDEKVKEFGLEENMRFRMRPNGPQHRNCTNTSGIIGISKTVSYKNGYEYWGWTASYQKNKRQKHKHFSINYYGEITAFKMACQVRFEWCGEIRVYRGTKLPCRIPVPYSYITSSGL